ncbi:hypothetical protein HID58_088886, partial [Brassica napus]
TRSYASGRREDYNLFDNVKPGDDDFKKAWEKEMENDDDDDTLWSGSEDEYNANTQQEHDSDKLYSVWSGTDEEKTLWTGDDDDDIPTDPHPSEASDKYSDKLFEFEEKPKYRTISELTEHAVLQGYADSHERSKLQIHT